MVTLRKSALATSIFIALSASSLVGVNQALAQEAATQDKEDSFEIISISRKRPESLQEVPIAVTAISEKMIENAEIKITIESSDNIGCIKIKDNAGGIPTDVIERIFEPYYTTKEQGKGTGLGLYMSKMIIEDNMQGSIIVENKENGAEFIIVFAVNAE